MSKARDSDLWSDLLAELESEAPHIHPLLNDARWEPGEPGMYDPGFRVYVEDDFFFQRLKSPQVRRELNERYRRIFGTTYDFPIHLQRGNMEAPKPATDPRVNPSVKLYFSKQSGGSIVAHVRDEREFLEGMADALASQKADDFGERLKQWLPQIIDIACRYRGYKAEAVFESRVLTTGRAMPRAEDLVAEFLGSGNGTKTKARAK